MAFDIQKTNIEITATDKTKVAFDSVRSNLTGVAGQLGALTGLLGAGAFVAFTKRIIDQADSMNDLSKRTGIAVEQIGAWRLATEQSGTSMDALTQALGKGAKYLVQHGDDLKKIGINAKTSEELILQLSGVISKMPSDDPRRTALAMQVLGKSAGELIPLLSEGEQGLRKMLDRGRELNPVTAEMAKNADTFNDNLAEMKLISGGLFVNLVGSILPSMNTWLTKLSLVINEGDWVDKLGFVLGYTTGKIADKTEKPQDQIKKYTEHIIELKKELAGLPEFGKYSYLKGSKLEEIKTAEAGLAGQRARLPSLNPKRSSAATSFDATNLDAFLKTDSSGSAKPKADTIGDRIRALAFENKLLAQGVPLEDARTIARLKGDKATDAQIVLILNATAVQTQFEAAEKASQKTKEDLIKATEGYAEAMLKLSDASFDAVKNAQDEAAAQERNLQVMQLGESAVIRMDAARLSEAAASAEQGLAYAKLNGLSAENITFVEIEILRIKQLAAERLRLANGQDAQTAFEKDKQHIEDLAKAQDDAFKKTEQDVQRTADSIYNSITDSLVRGFEKNGGSFKSFLKSLQNTANTTVIRLGIDFAMNASGLNGLISQVARVVSGAGGGASASPLGVAGGGASGGGIFGSASNLLSVGKSIYSGFSGALSSNIGGLVANFAPQLGSSIAGAMLGSAAGLGPTVAGSASGIGALTGSVGSLGSAISTALPYIGLAIGAFSLIKSVFGKKKIPRFSSQITSTYADGKFAQANGIQQYKPLGAEKQLGGLSEQFSRTLGGFLTGFGLDDSVSTKADLLKKRKKSYGMFEASFAGGSVSASNSGKAKNVQDTFARLIETVLGSTLVQAIQKTNVVQGIKDLFTGLTDKTQVVNMINASLSLNQAQVELADRFGLTLDAAGKVSVASGKAGDDLAKFATSIASAGLATRTIGTTIVKSRDDLYKNLNQVFGDVVTEAVTVSRQVPINAPKINSFASILGFGNSLTGYGKLPAKNGLAGILGQFNAPAQQFKTITEQITTFVSTVVGRGTALPKTLAGYDDLLKGIDKTSAAGQKMFADVFALRDQFIAFTGAVDGLKGNVRGALFGIVSDAEKQQYLNEDLAKIFGDLKIKVPGSIDELIGLGKSIDYTTAKGLDLAAAFPSLVSAFQETKDGIVELVASLRDESGFKTLYDYNFYKGIAGNYGAEFANRYSDGAAVTYGASNNTSVSLPNNITPQNNTTISTSDPNMLVAISTLTTTVNALKAELVAIKSSSAETSRILTNVTEGGRAMQTEVYA